MLSIIEVGLYKFTNFSLKFTMKFLSWTKFIMQLHLSFLAEEQPSHRDEWRHTEIGSSSPCSILPWTVEPMRIVVSWRLLLSELPNWRLPLSLGYHLHSRLDSYHFHYLYLSVVCSVLEMRRCQNTARCYYWQKGRTVACCFASTGRTLYSAERYSCQPVTDGRKDGWTDRVIDTRINTHIYQRTTSVTLLRSCLMRHETYCCYTFLSPQLQTV